MTLKNVRVTQWHHRSPPKHLLRYRVDIGKIGLIGECRESIVPDDPIDLRLGLTLNLRVHHHRQVKRVNRRHSLDGNKTPGFVSVSHEWNKQDGVILTVSAAPAKSEAADHLMLCSVYGVTSSLSSNSDVYEGTALPAAYN